MSTKGPLQRELSQRCYSQEEEVKEISYQFRPAPQQEKAD